MLPSLAMAGLPRETLSAPPKASLHFVVHLYLFLIPPSRHVITRILGAGFFQILVSSPSTYSFLPRHRTIIRMSEEMSVKHAPLTLIVAATTKNGIGKDGALPWPMLKKEMRYFARVTTRVPMPSQTGSLQSDTLKQDLLAGTQRNAVIMGRKTWESIPTKFRPLKDRTNIVISSQSRHELQDIPEDVVVATSISSALEAFSDRVKEGKALPLGRAFVIGGSSIYESALDLPQTKHVLLTRVQNDFECDTFFSEKVAGPDSTRQEWQRASLTELRDFTGEDVPDGPVSELGGNQEVQYEFQLYERP